MVGSPDVNGFRPMEHDGSGVDHAGHIIRQRGVPNRLRLSHP